ncbi:MAG TPA: GspH/FimT family pseudopilin [Candidatus Eisenbacteria bacterium]
MTKKRAARSRRPRRRRDGRFGLSDLVVVLLIFGIVTASAVPGFNRFMRSLDLNKQVQRVAAMLRVVRQKAITDNRVCVVWWNAGEKRWGFWEDENNNGKRDEGESTEAPVTLPASLRVDRAGTNPFPSDSVRFLPDGSASASGSLIFSNPDGYTRSLSVVRLTGMVTVQ